jgi:hypothetical protein
MGPTKHMRSLDRVRLPESGVGALVRKSADDIVVRFEHCACNHRLAEVVEEVGIAAPVKELLREVEMSRCNTTMLNTNANQTDGLY